MIKKILEFINNSDNYKNKYFLKYNLFKFFDKLKNTPGEQSKDTFNWDRYNLHYRGELKEIAKTNTLTLETNDYSFINSELIKTNKNIKPLHSNWRLLYETILQLKPKSVFEIGCGNGMHLNNIQILAPEINLSGIDRDEKQIQFLHELYPNLKSKIILANATEPFPQNLCSTVDLAFTQAVIMHIHEQEKHKIALANLFNISSKYVILIERWRNHPFLDDIKELFNDKLISWEKINFYYRISPENNIPSMIICSKEPLNYPELTNYEILPKN
jgi:SAM-dependent methyltransferase